MKRWMALVFVLYVAMVWMDSDVCIAKPRYGGTLTFGSEEDIVELDTHRGGSRFSRRFKLFYTNGLVEMGRNYEIVPSLAQSWELSKDGLQYTFRLRKGVKFHNGREVTAEDIKFNFERIRDPKNAALGRGYLQDVTSVGAADRYTVKVALSKPCGAFLEILSNPNLFIIAPECVNQEGKVTQLIGTGPFQFLEWKPKLHIKLKKFNGYWEKGIPYVDNLTVKILTDPVARLNAVTAGDVDITHNLPVSQVLDYKKRPPKNIQVLMEPTAGANLIVFNIQKPPFNDARVRRAVGYGINKKELLQAMYQGYGETVNQLFLKGSKWYFDFPDFVQDKEKARALLKEVYPKGLECRMVVAAPSAMGIVAAQVIQEQLKDVGFKIVIEIHDMATLYAKMNAGDFEFMSEDFGPMQDPIMYYPFAYIRNSPYKRMVGGGEGYDNPRVKELFDKAGATSKYEERKALYTEALRTALYDDAVNIFLVQSPLMNACAIRSYTKGFQAHPEGWFVYPKGGLAHTWLEK